MTTLLLIRLDEQVARKLEALALLTDRGADEVAEQLVEAGIERLR